MTVDDFNSFISWCVDSFLELWQAFGTWGVIGAFIILMPLLRKLVQLLKNLWKGGV